MAKFNAYLKGNGVDLGLFVHKAETGFTTKADMSTIETALIMYPRHVWQNNIKISCQTRNVEERKQIRHALVANMEEIVRSGGAAPPLNFIMPSRNWNYSVFITNVPLKEERFEVAPPLVITMVVAKDTYDPGGVDASYMIPGRGYWWDGSYEDTKSTTEGVDAAKQIVNQIGKNAQSLFDKISTGVNTWWLAQVTASKKDESGR